MLTLLDINRVTNSNDGNIYSDLYKDVYGSRPRYVQFESIEEFDEDFEFLVNRLSIKNEEEKIQKSLNWNRFLNRVYEVRDIVAQTTTEDAIRIIADAEDIDAEELSFYGWESLEYALNLNFGSIKQFLAENVA